MYLGRVNTIKAALAVRAAEFGLAVIGFGLPVLVKKISQRKGWVAELPGWFGNICRPALRLAHTLPINS